MLKISGRRVLYGLGTLLLCATLVQIVYATLVRPRVEAFSAASTFAARGERIVRRHSRAMLLVIKDYEQQAALILAAWALSLLAGQAIGVVRNRRLLEKRYIVIGERDIVLPEHAQARSRSIEALAFAEREMLLPRALMQALHRFSATRSVHDAEEAVRRECEAELSRFESALAVIRLCAWAISALGFVGMARGVGVAVRQARDADAGDLSSVTVCLSFTFISTLTALVLCILVVYVLQRLQQAQDRLISDTHAYVDRALIQYMRAL